MNHRPARRIDELLRLLRIELSRRGYSHRTVRSYSGWLRRLSEFHAGKEPSQLGSQEVTAFLSHLTTVRRASPTSQNQARAALAFVYRELLRTPLRVVDRAAWRPPRLPSVITREEVAALLVAMCGTTKLMACLLYGSGLRLQECVGLRVADLDLVGGQMTVRPSETAPGRTAWLPAALITTLREHLDGVRRQYILDVRGGAGYVALPASESGRASDGPRSWSWQWVFPASRVHVHVASGQRRRHHVHERVLQRAVRAAADAAKLSKPVSCQTLRHSFAVHSLEGGSDTGTVQRLLGHRELRTTTRYTHLVDSAQLARRAAR